MSKTQNPANTKISDHKSGMGNAFFQKYTIILAWVILIVVFSILRPDTFATWQNVTTILGSKAVLVVLALAIMVPLIAGDYDMSIASVMTFSSMLLAILNVWLGVPLGVAIVIAIGAGIGIGAVNGAIVTRFEIDPFIVTMGMATLMQGVTLGMSNSSTITGIDEALKTAVYTGRLFGISYVFYYAVIACAILFYFFQYTYPGRKVLMVGRGKNVAKLSGIKVNKVRLLCFMSSGGIAAFAGVLYAGMLGSADPSSGLSYLMPAFAAVFLGSTTILPGRFNPWGTLIAVYFLVTGTTGLSLMGIQTFVQDIFYGAALILAVLSSVLVKRAQDKRELKMAEMKLAKEKES
jgi:ribose transport system permease protein